ncbi:putative lipid II flippase FtsW [Candidatus Venteria ishoeyi]|uniref:putative lipid II flippase FtsW n=1 Tax=Candidatus Venteria ishoeyi TaxID=1899563 RepID=UPI0025A66D54|nr:putative lipid II flippase FtsW [Candidatus Venteria ishoeyi]MDM8545688.1 putative lipid II flippase FtsW [Candidatus Venteria ishoeyi]
MKNIKSANSLHPTASRRVQQMWNRRDTLFQHDGWLIFALLGLLLSGLVMVASTSVQLGDLRHGDSLYFFWRQLIYSGVGGLCGLIGWKLGTRQWQQLSVFFLLFGLLLLLLVLIPGIGREVNGSMRWMDLGPIRLQPSEPMKLFMILYLSGYLVRRSEEVRESVSGFIKPMLVLILITALLLLEPDYGAVVVLFLTVLGLLFLAGVPLKQFLVWLLVVSMTLFGVMLLAPYRLQRLSSFVDPWADPFNGGFQLTQALIAMGRGGWFGVGLGESVQKLTYLPEAHTDFVFAILAEELGLSGSLLIIALFALLISRGLRIARTAMLLQRPYAAWLAYGISLNIGLQVTINLGVNMGLLPTKGLTLPLMSYGGSSMLVVCLMMGLLLRVDYENRYES